MDYERLAAASEAFIYVAMTRVMVGRLPWPSSSWTVSETGFSAVRHGLATPSRDKNTTFE
jgi:hypothetical protein